MSKPGRLRKLWGYEADVPRCGNCKQYLKAKNRLVDGDLVRMPARCGAGRFTVDENGCCDHWVGRDGVRLDTAPADPVSTQRNSR